MGSVGEDIDGVGGDDEDRVGSGGGDLRDDGLEQGVVGLYQVETGLPGFLVHSGRDDDGRGVGAVGIAPRADLGLGEVGGVRYVGGLAHGAVLVDVDEDDLGYETGEEQRVGRCCAYGTCADDGDFVGLDRDFC